MGRDGAVVQRRIEAAQRAQRAPGALQLGQGEQLGIRHRWWATEIGLLQQVIGEVHHLRQFRLGQRRPDVQQIILQLDQIAQHMAAMGVEEIDHPHIPGRVDEDVGAVEITMHPGKIVRARQPRQTFQFALVEQADMWQTAAVGEVQLVAGAVATENGADPFAHAGSPFGLEVVVVEQIGALGTGGRIQSTELLAEHLLQHARDFCLVAATLIEFLQRARTAATHRGVAILDAAAIGQIGEIGDPRRAVAEHRFDAFEGTALLAHRPLRTDLDHVRHFLVAVQIDALGVEHAVA